ncbi:MAG: GNAT family N-acetyltransferase [Candidatus Woesearchaeota archaeon]|nr:GNAT family N-acetyltransferase [Candidatus Woesearchaeota archaeon]
MKTEIISAIPENRDKWNSRIEKLERKDIYLSFEYIKMLADFLCGKGELFYFEEGENFALYPYIKKEINILPFFKQVLGRHAGTYYDITTPEYGGIMVNSAESERNAFFSSALLEFESYSRKAGIITEFARLNSMLGNYKSFIENKIEGAVKSKDIVYVDLGKSEEQIFNEFKKENRKCIRKAGRNGIRIRIGENNSDIDSFRALYLKTMEKRNARDEYLFSREYFMNLFDGLKGKITLFLAEYNGIPVVGSILLHSGDIAYDYLRGSDDKFQSLRANNLTVYEIIKWAKKNGYRFFVMGGGYKENDAIFNFKSTFSNTTAPFYNYKKIHNDSLYSDFSCAFEEYAKVNNIRFDENYFPKYRGED